MYIYRQITSWVDWVAIQFQKSCVNVSKKAGNVTHSSLMLASCNQWITEILILSNNLIVTPSLCFYLHHIPTCIRPLHPNGPKAIILNGKWSQTERGAPESPTPCGWGQLMVELLFEHYTIQQWQKLKFHSQFIC